MVASYFTDVCGNKMAGNEERLKVCSRVLCHLMKSWSGLIYLATNAHPTLSFIVQSLRMPLQGYRVSPVFEKNLTFTRMS